MFVYRSSVQPAPAGICNRRSDRNQPILGVLMVSSLHLDHQNTVHQGHVNGPRRPNTAAAAAAAASMAVYQSLDHHSPSNLFPRRASPQLLREAPLATCHKASPRYHWEASCSMLPSDTSTVEACIFAPALGLASAQFWSKASSMRLGNQRCSECAIFLSS